MTVVPVKVSNLVPYPLDYINRIAFVTVVIIQREDLTMDMQWSKYEIPRQSVVIPGSLDKLLKLVKSLDCPGQPWTVGSYAIGAIKLESLISRLNKAVAGGGGGVDSLHGFWRTPPPQTNKNHQKCAKKSTIQPACTGGCACEHFGLKFARETSVECN